MRVLNSLSNDIHVEHVVKTSSNPRVGFDIMVGSVHSLVGSWKLLYPRHDMRVG
jgi:hypothetical protein